MISAGVYVNGSALVFCGRDMWFVCGRNVCAIFFVLMVFVCQSIGDGTGWDNLELLPRSG
jgi:hypothetical protein